ncbi:MAG: hypothetical protein IJ779_07440 [Ruminococcus sp.]|nr:hypothetical protein [Ruminococcus sp.]
MNPLSAVKLLPLGKRFIANHPKMKAFVNTALAMMGEDSVVEIKVKNAEGRTIVSNFKLTADDVDLINELNKLKNE